MGLAAVGRRDRRGEEIFQLEDAAAGRHVFVGGDARNRQFVHADGVGDGLEIERTQMLDAVGEEGVLLAHDLGRHLEDGLGALIERADQPGRGLQAVGEIGLVLVALGGLGDVGVVALVDQHFRQRVGIELDHEAAVRPRPHEHVRHDRLHQRRSEGEARLRIELADFRDHVGQVFLVHAADPAQRREVAFRQQSRDGRPAPAWRDRSGRAP